MIITKLGASGEAVKEIQQLLINRGYSLAVTGIFDEATKDDVKDFQKKMGLKDDGEVGDATRKALRGGPENTGPVKPEPTPAKNTRPLDPISVERAKKGHPKVREELLLILREINDTISGNALCRYAYVTRTFDEQTGFYKQGRTVLFDKNGKRLGIVTNAKAGYSLHNYSLAVDIVLMIDKDGNGTYETAAWDTKGDYDSDKQSDWMECVKIFKKHGWVWGGDFKSIKDAPHFEKSFGYSVTQLLKLHNEGKVDSEGYVLI